MNDNFCDKIMLDEILDEASSVTKSIDEYTWKQKLIKITKFKISH